jgi:ATP-dependent Clp protease protease subunit
MLHQPWGGVTGTAADITILANEIINLKELCALILSESTGQPISKIKQDSDLDFYMSAEEALKYGLIDKVVLPSSKPPTPAS